MYIRSPKELALAVMNQRKKLDLSQADVADLVGLKQKTISGFENKPEGVQLDTLFRILSAINLAVHITSREETPPLEQWKEEW